MLSQVVKHGGYRFRGNSLPPRSYLDTHSNFDPVSVCVIVISADRSAHFIPSNTDLARPVPEALGSVRSCVLWLPFAAEVYEISAHHGFYDDIAGCGKSLADIFVKLVHCDDLLQTPQRYGLSATAFFSSSRTYSGLMTSTL